MTLKETRDVQTAFWTITTNANYGNTIFEGRGKFFDPEVIFSTLPDEESKIFEKTN